MRVDEAQRNVIDHFVYDHFEAAFLLYGDLAEHERTETFGDDQVVGKPEIAIMEAFGVNPVQWIHRVSYFVPRCNFLSALSQLFCLYVRFTHT